MGYLLVSLFIKKTPCIASDVCDRTKGAILFKSRSEDELYKKIIHVMKEEQKELESLNSIKVKDYSSETLKLFLN